MLSLLVLTSLAAEPLDGADVYSNNCGRCHNPRTPADLGEDAWRAVSFHMRVKANLTPGEFEALELFLIPPAQQAAGAAALDPRLVPTCTLCHDGARIEDAIAAGRSEAAWSATLDRMRRYGAAVNAEEADELAAWLATQAP